LLKNIWVSLKFYPYVLVQILANKNKGRSWNEILQEKKVKDILKTTKDKDISLKVVTNFPKNANPIITGGQA